MTILEATINNDIVQLKECINEGNINEQDVDSGFTALHYAAQNGNMEILKLLLENNAIVDVKDNYGNTALFKAVFFSKGKTELIKMLISYGANADIENNSGVSPRKLAASIANFDITSVIG